MMSANEARELLRAVDRVLPNIGSYLRDALKKENLSPEAEALRARYDTVLMSLEKLSSSELQPPPAPRHASVRKSLGDSPGLPPLNRTRMLNKSRTEGDIVDVVSPSLTAVAGEGLEVIPEQPDQIPDLSGPLLRRDDNLRWHRSFCRFSPAEKSLQVYESPEETQYLYALQLDSAKINFNPEGCDREHSFAITLPIPDPQPPITIVTPDHSHQERYFAAYSEVDYRHWKTTLEYLLYMPHRPRLLNGTDLVKDGFTPGSGETPGSGDKNGHLPPPPPGTLILGNDGDEDHFSDETIYEDIDELVQQFDLTMKSTMQAMQQMSPKKTKKKKREFFGGSIGKSSGMKIMEEKRTQLEYGEQHRGYLHKRSGGGSWKKKYCVLKGCIFSYSKSLDDPQKHEYILLRAELKIVKDTKKQHAFQLACRGVPEVIFAASGEQELLEWFTLIESATKRTHELSSLVEDTLAKKSSSALPEGIYNVPRSVLMAEGYYNTPSSLLQPAATPSSEPVPPALPSRGIYDVPRASIGDELSPMPVSTLQGRQLYLSGNPFDLYDVPRASANDSSPPEDEVIYDYPLDLDLGDMEIYDYPPDASELGLPSEEPKEDTPHGSSSNRDSGSTVSNEYPSDSPHAHTPISSAGSSSNRQSTAGSLGSMEDMTWATSSTSTTAGEQQLESLESFLDSISNSRPSSSVGLHPAAAEFGHCTIKGPLYRKERVRWTKCHCLIRNSFFECHKSSNISSSSKPLIKLFLPGTKISLVQDAKRQYSFQMKHPRREGALLFAAENETECLQWMEAFDAAVTIQVSKVDDVEQIRVNDSALFKKWNSLEKGLGETNNGRSEEDIPDSVKRRSLRMTFGKGKRKSMNRDTKSSGVLTSGSHTTSTELLAGDRNQHSLNSSMHRSSSLDPLASPNEETPTGPHIESTSHRAMSPVGTVSFQGYLRVKQRPEEKGSRHWCVLDDLTIKCFTSRQGNSSVIHQVSLKGSTITQADTEAKKKHTFRVWNSETRQCFYFSAYDESEYQSWFSEVTEGADQLAAEVSKKVAGKAGSSPVFYFSRDGRTRSRSGSMKRSSGSVNSLDHSDGDSGSIASSGQHGAIVAYQGRLKKREDKNMWTPYHCQVVESHLQMFLNSEDQAPINSLPLRDCTLERINLPPHEVERFAFTILIQAIVHTFAAPSDQALHGWLQAVQGCINKAAVTPVSTPTIKTKMRKSRSSSRKEKSRSEVFAPSMVVPKMLNPPASSSTMRVKGREPPAVFKTTESEIVSYVPASSLVNPLHSGYVEVQLDTAVWVRYWCIVHKNSLYVYANKDSKSTVRTIMLPGHEVKALGSTSKKNFAIALVHSGLHSVCLAPFDQIDMRKWFMALEHATKSDETTQQPSTTSAPASAVNTGATAAAKPQADSSADSREAISPEEFITKQLAIIGQYEKKMRRTQKVSRMTEQNLDSQRAGMQQLKDKFENHMAKLQEKAGAGDQHAQRKLQELKVKMHQIDKVLPYLQKYVQVNQQAEMQTMAILKESCTQEIQKLKSKYKLSRPVAGMLEPSFSTLPLTRQEKNKLKMNSLTRPKKSHKSKKHTSEDHQQSVLERQQSAPTGQQAPSSTSVGHSEPVAADTSSRQVASSQRIHSDSSVQQRQEPVFVRTPSPPVADYQRSQSNTSVQREPVFVRTPSPPVTSPPTNAPSLPSVVSSPVAPPPTNAPPLSSVVSPPSSSTAYEEPQYAVLSLAKGNQTKPKADDKPMYAELTLHGSPSISTKFSHENTVNYSSVTMPPLVDRVGEEDEPNHTPLSSAQSSSNPPPPPQPLSSPSHQPLSSSSRQPPPVSAKPSSRTLKSQLSDAPSYPAPPPPPPAPSTPFQATPQTSLPPSLSSQEQYVPPPPPQINNGPQNSDSGDLRSVQLVWPGAEDQNVDLLNRTQCHANETAAMSEVSHIKRSGVPSIAQRMKAFQQ